MTHVATPDIARTAAVLADPSRAAMALAMMDGRAWTMTELAAVAGIARPTATEHGHRLVEGGLCVEVRQGRHRYLRLRDADVADLLERLGALSAAPGRPPSSLRGVTRDAALRRGRTCYGHLAGELGVRVSDELQRLAVVTQDWGKGPAAETWFARLGIDAGHGSRRPATRPCLDWTERREHLAGRLADELCAVLLERGWLTRVAQSRAVRLTLAGCGGLADLGVDVAAMAR